MKNQLIKINKTVYDRMGNAYKSCIIPVVHRMQAKEEFQRQGLQMDTLQAILIGSNFKVPVRAFKSPEDINTRKSFEVFTDDAGNTAIWEIAVSLPEGVEFSETSITAATLTAFEEKFAKDNTGAIETGVVELIEL